ncbi:MAG: acetyl-CoA hydrolase/transferase C-terminal domain-containing protein [Oscillibacter sp.]
MSQYTELYAAKKTTVEEALSRIPSGSVIGHSFCAGEPATLLGNLHTLQGKAKDLRVIRALDVGQYPFAMDPQYQDTFTVDSMFFMGPDRASHKAKQTSFIPTHLHNLSRCYDYHRPNVALISVTPMDEHGYLRCSLSLISEKELVEGADLVIAEVNPNLPCVAGETEFHISQFDAIVEAATPIPQLPKGTVEETDRTIGSYIASLVRDGDTLQLGIGAIPDAAAHALLGKHDLGIHTEMLTTSLVDLVEAGVITGRKKTINKGKIVGTFALGDQRLYDMMNNNPSVVLLPGSYVNDPFVVAQNDNMVSINTCISVDLTGQVNSESVGTLQFSGSGGQFDTAFGAGRAKGGRSIIALHATAKKGTISTICPVLAPGAVVTLSRNNVDYIVTEFGIAPMRGRPIRERVENLIAIAHPDFRKELRAQAEAYGIW